VPVPREQKKDVGLDSTATVKEYVCSDLVDGQTIILDMRLGRYLGLDRVGASIWALLQLGKPLREIVTILTEEYLADETRISGDVVRFVGELRERGLVEISHGGGCSG
jgi:coenzyme PQQ synthesis protein D (PqqD)